MHNLNTNASEGLFVAAMPLARAGAPPTLRRLRGSQRSQEVATASSTAAIRCSLPAGGILLSNSAHVLRRRWPSGLERAFGHGTSASPSARVAAGSSVSLPGDQAAGKRAREGPVNPGAEASGSGAEEDCVGNARWRGSVGLRTPLVPGQRGSSGSACQPAPDTLRCLLRSVETAQAGRTARAPDADHASCSFAASQDVCHGLIAGGPWNGKRCM